MKIIESEMQILAGLQMKIMEIERIKNEIDNEKNVQMKVQNYYRI